MNNIAISFMFSYASFKVFGYDSEKSFLLSAKEFKRHISAIKLTRHKGKLYSRTYYFKDQSSCTYKDNYFNIQSKN